MEPRRPACSAPARTRGGDTGTDTLRATRWAAASGYAALACGAGAVAFERTRPGTQVPDGAAGVALATAHADDLLAQSLLFVLGAGFTLVFVAALRRYLDRTRLLATVAFGAGVATATLQLVAQAGQVALANAGREGLEPGPVAMMSHLDLALFTVAGLPTTVMLGAVGWAALRSGAFPAWLGWSTVAVAAVHLLPVAGIVTTTGPLVPAGWVAALSYALYALWLVATTTVMVVRLHPQRITAAHAASIRDAVR